MFHSIFDRHERQRCVLRHVVDLPVLVLYHEDLPDNHREFKYYALTGSADEKLLSRMIVCAKSVVNFLIALNDEQAEACVLCVL